MIASIHQPQYMPWLGYIDKIEQSDVFIVLDNVQYKKNEWQNRNRIRTSQGWQWITVPVIHQFGQKINEIKINNRIPWRKRHLNSIQFNFSRTRFFAKYFPYFQDVYQRDWEYLADINFYLINGLVQMLGIKTPIVKASDYQSTDHPTQRLVDLCQKVGAKSYLSGKDGPNYMDMTKFDQKGINVQIQDFVHPAYRQQWGHKNNHNFISHLSIIDLLFNEGEHSLEIIKGSEAMALSV